MHTYIYIYMRARVHVCHINALLRYMCLYTCRYKREARRAPQRIIQVSTTHKARPLSSSGVPGPSESVKSEPKTHIYMHTYKYIHKEPKRPLFHTFGVQVWEASCGTGRPTPGQGAEAHRWTARCSCSWALGCPSDHV